MLGFIWKILPKNYKFNVVFKKAGSIASKAVVGLIVGSAIGKHLSPENIELIKNATAILTATGLEVAHDWVKLKWPNNKFVKSYL